MWPSNGRQCRPPLKNCHRQADLGAQLPSKRLIEPPCDGDGATGKSCNPRSRAEDQRTTGIRAMEKGSCGRGGGALQHLPGQRLTTPGKHLAVPHDGSAIEMARLLELR